MAHPKVATCRRRAALMAAAAVIAIGTGVRSSISAQSGDRIAEAQVLYANAEYVETLRALAEEGGVEAYQYRALSLLALGRTVEAQQALEALVTSTPGYAPLEEDMPPRFIALLTQTKQKLLPSVLRRLLTSGRQQFQANSFEEARKEFDLLLTLASDPTVRDLADVADLRLLASGFIDLMAGGAPTPSASPEPPMPTLATAPRKPVSIPPVAISQRIPSWPAAARPPELAATAVGAVRLRIGADGRVKSATLQRGVDPHYDLKLLASARQWEYKPATLDGVPIESETVVTFRVAQRP